MRGRNLIPVEQSEGNVQTEITDALKKMGYRAYSTSTYRKPSRGHGASKKGMPDVLVSHDGWPVKGIWLAMETKKPKESKKSAEQDELEAKGRIVVVTSLDEAIAAVREVEARLRKESG